MTSPATFSVVEAARLIASGELSPVELTRSILERIERIDPRLKAYVAIFHEEALAEAKRAANEISMLGPRSSLHGIPVAIKDVYDIEGKPTLAGSRVRVGHIADADSEVVKRLREAGAIIVGKTVTHEFASGVTSPPTRNPWDLNRIPGGSSGGSGAALAADLCLAATGTDTAGSIRIPASVNGVVGLKPTFGRISKRGIVPLSWSLDHVGPLAKTVHDAALMLNTLAGYDPADVCSIKEPVRDFTDRIDCEISGFKVGVAQNWYLDRIGAAVAKATQEAARTFEDLGASVEEIEIQHLDLAMEIHSTILSAEASAYHQSMLPVASESYRRGTRVFLQAGQLIPATAYLNAQRARELIRQGFREAFSRVDVLIGPTLPTVAALFGSNKVEVNGTEEDITQAYTRLSIPANLAGLPALSVPCGYHLGLPLGLQLIGKPLDERTVLRAGHAYEQATNHHLKRPNLV
ncbi:aspartyl/glutamyl-tRNA(Asn/Gln) amidotransferase subunit A [Rubrobacter xylanophilus DSM 9941]|uniref:Aspartyl/glutamyl-tRNA(Asn/Gln) amidotransferase subunit A n=1 Tax=Rubrobacter xylanophilus (strain DSM 9941 / JCM 11954 / NBRC 16129 / PRD-1) TaxID=266117 RepID=Q1AUV0_RUBXD|nr:Asp-tRNA(Asn)/Glu-tRNA(Gln) amidotransferase GatCAB subunit A [Rubrobacter xylanophilus]ABG04828.1 aspartyl/glutamyl-tRNA(Asn/Gln) amidotransferase subunit A [Rubrobacter xylanophilus DSM 9941]